MFVRKSKQKEYIQREAEKLSSKGIAKVEKKYLDIINKKNNTIRRLENQRTRYIDRSFLFDHDIKQLEEMDSLIDASYQELAGKIHRIRLKFRKNKDFILKNQHKLETIG